MRDQFRQSFALGVLALALAGCQAGSRSVLVSHPDVFLKALPDGCGLKALADLRGQPFSALAGRPLSGDLRVIRRNEAVTREIDTRRINAMVDEKGMVLKLFCG